MPLYPAACRDEQDGCGEIMGGIFLVVGLLLRLIGIAGAIGSSPGMTGFAHAPAGRALCRPGAGSNRPARMLCVDANGARRDANGEFAQGLFDQAFGRRRLQEPGASIAAAGQPELAFLQAAEALAERLRQFAAARRRYMVTQDEHDRSRAKNLRSMRHGR